MREVGFLEEKEEVSLGGFKVPWKEGAFWIVRGGAGVVLGFRGSMESFRPVGWIEQQQQQKPSPSSSSSSSSNRKKWIPSFIV